MEEESKIQQVLDKINIINTTLITHIATQDVRDEVRDKQLSAVYKIMVTGNGDIPLTEVVRNHSAWIEEHNKDQDETYKEDKEMLMMNVVDEKKNKTDNKVSKRQFLIAIAVAVTTQVIGFIFIGIEFALRMR